jgi:hypothetical protein
MHPTLKPEAEAGQAPPFNWRSFLPVHPAGDLLPLMSEAELQELAKDIAKNSLRTQIVTYSETDEAGRSLHVPILLDGRNRLDALALLGLLYETPDHHLGLKKWTDKGWSNRSGSRIEAQYIFGGDAYAIALSFNVHRRHLTAEQKRDLIAKLVTAKPDLSDRQLGKMAKASKNTVASVRTDLELRGQVDHVEKRTDTKGRKQPAKRTNTTKVEELSEHAERLGVVLKREGKRAYSLYNPATDFYWRHAAPLAEIAEALAKLENLGAIGKTLAQVEADTRALCGAGGAKRSEALNAKLFGEEEEEQAPTETDDAAATSAGGSPDVAKLNAEAEALGLSITVVIFV